VPSGWSRAAAAVALALAIFGRPATTHAHANLVRSDPPAGATLDVAPAALVLEFSEDLDVGFSRVSLLDSRGREVDAGPGEVDPADPRVLRLRLGDLPRDSFTAVWRNRSAVDGHIREGVVPFGVGVAADPTVLLPPAGAPDPTLAPPSPWEAILRWLNLVAAALMLGGIPFMLAVWRPACRAARRAGADVATADEAMGRAVRRAIVLGGVGLLAAGALLVVDQAATAAGVPWSEAIGAPIGAFLGGRSGRLWLLRVGLVLALIALARRSPPAEIGRDRPWWAALGIGGVILLTFSLNGHGAAVRDRPAVAVAMDWLHLAATTAWLGGLVPLAAAIRAARRRPAQTPPLASLIPRFSQLALASVAALGSTGLYAYFLHIDDRSLLAATTYGRALLVKLAFFGGLLLLGALNLLVLSPRLARARGSAAPALGGTVGVEMLLGALALLAAGALTSVPPSRDAAEAQARAGVLERGGDGDASLTLRVAPGLVGANAVAVDLADARPGAAGAPATVVLRLTRPGADSVPIEVHLPPAGEEHLPGGTAGAQRFLTSGSIFTTPGRWLVEVIVRRPGLDDLLHRFTPRITRTADERVAMSDGPALVLSGAPVPASPASIAAGAAVFRTHCAACHGSDGRGDGPAAAGLDPPPADLRVHVSQHDDAQLHSWIGLGIPGTAMPGFRDKIGREDLWHVVNYLRATFD